MSSVHNNTAASRYELQTEWGMAHLDYHETLDAISLDHTHVPEGAQGKGVASSFVLAVLKDIRAHNRKIIPRCEFIQAMLKKHPDYADMILA